MSIEGRSDLIGREVKPFIIHALILEFFGRWKAQMNPQLSSVLRCDETRSWSQTTSVLKKVKDFKVKLKCQKQSKVKEMKVFKFLDESNTPLLWFVEKQGERCWRVLFELPGCSPEETKKGDEDSLLFLLLLIQTQFTRSGGRRVPGWGWPLTSR